MDAFSFAQERLIYLAFRVSWLPSSLLQSYAAASTFWPLQGLEPIRHEIDATVDIPLSVIGMLWAVHLQKKEQYQIQCPFLPTIEILAWKKSFCKWRRTALTWKTGHQSRMPSKNFWFSMQSRLTFSGEARSTILPDECFG